MAEPAYAADNGVPRQDAKGRFVKGNRAGTGNPNLKRSRQLRIAFGKAATPKKIRDLEGVIYQLAMAGDMVAAKLYLEYTIGKPKAQEDDDGPTVAPLVIEPPLPLGA